MMMLQYQLILFQNSDSLVSSLWTASYALGNFIGPTFSGTLYEQVTSYDHHRITKANEKIPCQVKVVVCACLCKTNFFQSYSAKIFPHNWTLLLFITYADLGWVPVVLCDNAGSDDFPTDPFNRILLQCT